MSKRMRPLKNIASQSNLRSDRLFHWLNCSGFPIANDFISQLVLFNGGIVRLNPQRIYKLEKITVSSRHVIGLDPALQILNQTVTLTTSQNVNRNGLIQDSNLNFLASTADTENTPDALVIHGDRSLIEYKPENFYINSQFNIVLDAKLSASHNGVGTFQTYVMLDYKEFDA